MDDSIHFNIEGSNVPETLRAALERAMELRQSDREIWGRMEEAWNQLDFEAWFEGIDRLLERVRDAGEEELASAVGALSTTTSAIQAAVELTKGTVWVQRQRGDAALWLLLTLLPYIPGAGEFKLTNLKEQDKPIVWKEGS